jgi:hypothetical protein
VSGVAPIMREHLLWCGTYHSRRHLVRRVTYHYKIPLPGVALVKRKQLI